MCEIPNVSEISFRSVSSNLQEYGKVPTGDESVPVVGTVTAPASIGTSASTLCLPSAIGLPVVPVLVASGIAPPLSPPALSIDLMYFTYDGTNYLGTFYLDFQ